MALRSRIRTVATVMAAVLPLVPVAGCGEGSDNPGATPAANPGAAPDAPGPGASTPGGAPQGAAAGPKDKYAYYGKGDGYTPDQKLGRDTWIMWTGGNEKFFRLGSVTAGNLAIPVEYFRLLDSRGRSTRFQRLGLVNEPNFRQATQPDENGLWLDQWLGDDTYPDTKVYGEPTGIMGLRKFPNPSFDRSKWNVDEYYRNPAAMEPPYLDRDVVRLLPHGVQPAPAADGPRESPLGEPRREPRQPVPPRGRRLLRRRQDRLRRRERRPGAGR